MKDIAIFGAGGFGREVLTLIQDINKVQHSYNIVGFFDDESKKGSVVNDYPVLGTKQELNSWETELAVVIAIGNPGDREDVVNKIHNPNVFYPTLIHPTTIIGSPNHITIGKGCIICAGNIITTNIQIGDFVIMNLFCTVGHDAVINDYASFMPSVNISGAVKIGKNVYVGTGANIINEKEIGEHTIIGAGAVVTEPIPGYCTAVGVPAKVIKKKI